MTREIQLAWCREDDIERVRRFIDARWRRGHVYSRDEPLFCWQFHPTRLSCGDVRGPTVLLAWRGREIVGMFGATGFDFNDRGTSAPGMWVLHWYVAQDFQTSLVAAQMLLTMRNLGCAAIFGSRTNEFSEPMFRAARFEAMEDLPRWVAVIDVGQAADLLTVTTPPNLHDAGREFCESHFAEPPTSTGTTTVRWSDAFTSTWDDCWEKRMAPRFVCASRNSRYLQWRYIEHPRFAYHVELALSAEGEPVGAMVYRIEQVRNRQQKVMRVLEYLADRESEKPLAEALIHAARREGVAYADFYCSSLIAAKGLEDVGFRRQNARPDGLELPSRLQPVESGHTQLKSFFCLPPPLRGTLETLIRTGHVYVTKSDSDQDRPN